jgi:hypothetical protein
MPLRPFSANNVLRFSTATRDVAAPIPGGLAEGDLWVVIHLRRVTTLPETAVPEGFGLHGLSRSTGAHWRRVYWKFATAEDAGLESVEWTQDEEQQAMVQSIAISGVSEQPFSSDSPVFSRDGQRLSTHHALGITPEVDGTTLLISSNSVQGVTFSEPTTQGGAWEEHSQASQGSTSADWLGVAVFFLERLASEGPTGVITYTTTGDTTFCINTVSHIFDASVSTLDPQLLVDKRQELRQAADAEYANLWRNGAGESSIELEKDYATWAYADGTATTQQEDLITASKAITDMLRTKLSDAKAAYDANDAAGIEVVTWN